MRKDDFGRQLNSLVYLLLGLGMFVVILIAVFFYLKDNPNAFNSVGTSDETEIEVSSELIEQMGFVDDEHVALVIMNCTSCHSSKLVTQNRATKEGWRSMIKWMQETQNLHDLGDNQEKILDYLSKNYAPSDQSRRPNLKDVEWYDLD